MQSLLKSNMEIRALLHWGGRGLSWNEHPVPRVLRLIESDFKTQKLNRSLKDGGRVYFYDMYNRNLFVFLCRREDRQSVEDVSSM